MSSPTPDVKSVFGRALEIGSAAERAAYLDEACGDNARLRAEVVSLLEEQERMGSFLRHPAAPQAETVDHQPAEGPGARVGRYKLLQQIGEGGMGVVYMAEQEEPVRRRVALKLIKPGMDSAQVIARFEAERQALAMMDHLNIARVLDAGTTAGEPGGVSPGRPYFVMELVHGVPITRYCDDNRLTPRERLELFVPVCQAIQHAHTKGIIHRDIKPSNILVTLYDGRPVPKVIDFGVAKATEQRLTERTMFTQYGAVVGTFEYMSPEQAEMSALGVDTRSDIYSLGVLLYELLTGTTPLDRQRLRDAAFTDIIRMIKETEPSRPSAKLSASGTLPAVAAARKTEPAKLTKLVKGELDWIVMKCLEKDRTRRYETANGLARDVQRYLADEPVEACPPSAGYRLRRFARKYKRGVAATGAFVGLLVLGVVASSWLAVRATRAERRMQEERDRAQTALTMQVAERLEGDLWRLEMVGQALAATVGTRADWDESQFEGWMRGMLEKDDRIYGLCLAFEPRAFDPEREDYCLYLHRPAGGIQKDHLLPPVYRYRDRSWYKDAMARGPHWTEPFYDNEGAKIWIISFVAPLQREGRPVGVMTLDVSVEYFKRLRRWLEELGLGEHHYGFVISEAGVFISHPHPDYDLWQRYERKQEPQRITQVGEGNAAFADLAQRLRGAQRSGSGAAVDPAYDKPAKFLFAPVGRARWTFVVVIDN